MDNLEIIAEKLNIMTRSQTIHKYDLVLRLEELDQIITVTDDGTNDDAAL